MKYVIHFCTNLKVYLLGLRQNMFLTNAYDLAVILYGKVIFSD